MICKFNSFSGSTGCIIDINESLNIVVEELKLAQKGTYATLIESKFQTVK